MEYISAKRNFQTSGWVAWQIFSQNKYQICNVGGAPNDGVEERSIKVHQQAPDSGCRPDSAAWVMCGVTTTDPLGSQSRGRLDNVLGRAWFLHMPGKLGNCLPIHNIRAPNLQHKIGQRSQMDSSSSSSPSFKLKGIKEDMLASVKYNLQLNPTKYKLNTQKKLIYLNYLDE